MEAVLLKPKAYSLRTLRQETCKNTAKGVQKCIREALTHEEYAEVYRSGDEVGKAMRRFQSSNHVVHTIQQQKWALSSVDNRGPGSVKTKVIHMVPTDSMTVHR